jgi:hypothetical protein
MPEIAGHLRSIMAAREREIAAMQPEKRPEEQEPEEQDHD